MFRLLRNAPRPVRPLALLVIATLASGCGDDAKQHATEQQPRPLPLAAVFGSALPHLASHAGTTVLSWVEPVGDGVALRFATLGDNGWSSPQTVSTGEDWFVNWADFPSVEPITDTTWAAHWLRKKPGGKYAYDVVMAVSDDRGEHWQTPLTPHTDDTATEHGFVSLFPTLAGVGALWLDGRNTSGGHDGHAAHGGGMTLRAATINANSERVDEHLVDGLMCDCCQTDIALTDHGPVAVYRDRSPDEVRDIAIARQVEGQWLPGIPVATDNWQIDGCPVNGPAVAAQGKHVAVAWFTGAGDVPRVRIALSEDRGATFTRTVTLADQRPLGRVDIAVLPDGGAIVSWLSKRDGSTSELTAQWINASGHDGQPRSIATTAATRAAGFPQMVLADRQLIFAWTDARNKPTTVKSATLPLTALVAH